MDPGPKTVITLFLRYRDEKDQDVEYTEGYPGNAITFKLTQKQKSAY